MTDVDLPVGLVTAAPGTIGPMLEYGVLTKAFVERGGIWTWLDPGRTWAEHGPGSVTPSPTPSIWRAGRSRETPPSCSA
ncbi:hypothetical protein G7085_11555 [Tessaracoccus sp. HDW20]|uniref:hypothetical protein n=1 Tax=Tessaracoccus coleopterorum TaxID=2714950 RepID=UPI0018D31C6E|nr:hypothetical protein [Tessaracoccus coleopterorum]NHB85026.1 hypothetical protein [Tessaracoccus coleopterorum]